MGEIVSYETFEAKRRKRQPLSHHPLNTLFAVALLPVTFLVVVLALLVYPTVGDAHSNDDPPGDLPWDA